MAGRGEKAAVVRGFLAGRKKANHAPTSKYFLQDLRVLRGSLSYVRLHVHVSFRFYFYFYFYLGQLLAAWGFSRGARRGAWGGRNGAAMAPGGSAPPRHGMTGGAHVMGGTPDRTVMISGAPVAFACLMPARWPKGI